MIDEAVSVSVCVCLSVRLPSHKISETSEVLANQIRHGDRLSYENASRVNYNDLDLHSRSHTSL